MPEPGIADRIKAALRLASLELKRADRRTRELEAENERLKSSLEGRANLSTESTVFKGVGLGGKTAVETYRNANVGTFVQLLNQLGPNALATGREKQLFAIRSVLYADFESLYGTPPKTREEARRRELVRMAFASRPIAWALTGTQRRHEEFRHDLIALFLSSGVDTTTWDFVRRGVEEPAGNA